MAGMTPASRSNGPRPILAAQPDIVRERLAACVARRVAERGMPLNIEAATPGIEKATRWLTTIGKPWLFLSGNVGTGKTTLMWGILQTLRYYGVTCKMFRASDFHALFLNNIEQTDRQLLRGDWCEVLLLDDVGVDQFEYKEYGNAIRPFVKVIEERYNRQLPMVVSTNLSGEEIRDTYGERTIDRIKEMAVGIKYEGESFRK